MSENAPVAHWLVHAERGSLSHLLGRAHALDSTKVGRPHDMASLHFPVGGDRFRPCLEDVLEFLIREWGIDRNPGWQAALHRGRRRWRVKQLRSSVRDLPTDAAAVLESLGWVVESPAEFEPGDGGAAHRW